MNYSDFLSYVQEKLETILGTNRTVKLHKVIKNNDSILDALSILSDASNISPTIYLNSFYEEYCKGRDLGDILLEILKVYDEHSQQIGKQIDFNMDFFADFSKVRKKIIYRLIRKDSNTKLLQTVPHIDYLDFAIIFCCLINCDETGMGTTMIHEEHLSLWNVSIEEIYSEAILNTPLLLPSTITPMFDVIKEMYYKQIDNSAASDYEGFELLQLTEDSDEEETLEMLRSEFPFEMYVLTNLYKTNGATCLLYEGVLRDFSAKIGTDLYIIPSSIHELILIPYYKEFDTEHMNQLIKEVNKNELEEMEYLSDHVYVYHKDEECISML